MKNKKPAIDGRYQEKEYLIVEEILRNHGFLEDDDKDFDKFLSNPIKNEKLILESPSYKLSSLVKKYADNELSTEDLPTALKDAYNIPAVKAEKIAKELNEKILRFIQPATEKPIVKKSEKTLSSNEEIKRPPGKDVYREPIE